MIEVFEPDINVENGRLNEQFFDFEVFPNWWCCVIGKYPRNDDIPESIKDDFIVVTSDIPGAREQLLQIMGDRKWVNFGYNNKRYDNIILNGIANGFTPRQLKILSDCIIDPEVAYRDHESMRISAFVKRRYQNFIYQDMLDDNAGSLKEKEACMQLDIRESDVPFDKVDLTEQDKLEIIDYCKHDVWSGMQYYKQVLKSFIATKLLVGKVFNLPVATCYASTNAGLAGLVLGAKRTSWPDSERQDYVIPKELRQYINYGLPKNVVDRLCASPDKFNVILFGNVVAFANGGVHSIPIDPKYLSQYPNGTIVSEVVAKRIQLKNLRIYSDDEWVMINRDAGSFYPAMMIYWNVMSRAVADPGQFKEMYETRLRFKAEGNKSQDALDTSQAYKLILNTTSGAMGNKWLALYDPYMRTSMCRLGQLLITVLANNAYNQIGKDYITVIQSNTDGVLFYIHRSKLELFKTIGEEFTRITNILLEDEEEYKTWQRDVNNYILLKASGAEKSKGGFFVTDMIQPGYNRTRPLDTYVCRDAIKEYLKTGKDIVEHIYGETDISKFVVTCHKGSFSGIVREFRDGRPDEVLHKVNRTYASMDRSLGEIKKLERVQGEIRKYKAPGCPPNCELLNQDLSTYRVEDHRDDIDYMWYIANTIEMLSEPWYELKNNKIIPIKIYED